ncbi:MAG TPA: hypothetical protein VF624_16275 [Tepidisphaeraceae bacterium]|jgi:hypothetical protein
MAVLAQTTQPSTVLLALPWINLAIGLIALGTGIAVFRFNTRVRRAEWLTKLYEKFFENADLKAIRELIDCDPSAVPDALIEMVRSDDARLFDYLNFFEYVAYLESQHHLRFAEVDAMFGYYLRRIACVRPVRDIIESETMGFELLRALLRRTDRTRR